MKKLGLTVKSNQEKDSLFADSDNCTILINNQEIPCYELNIKLEPGHFVKAYAKLFVDDLQLEECDYNLETKIGNEEFCLIPKEKMQAFMECYIELMESALEFDMQPEMEDLLKRVYDDYDARIGYDNA